ncbi:bis-aminopropyl spermidine synthase family protein [Solirubrobacter soli]|uniref:bis-aminopropyl spermidine synthase family protein n=1 Tax=Solirubrobacter soli TaxID=363832 RepID=UPI000403E6E3|nr:bis-aminopropyl spermidine synthase family protein [Solirubrobacter soli]
MEAAPLDGRRIRAVAALAGLAPAEIVARTGVTLREVERVLAAGGSLPPRPSLADGAGIVDLLAGVPEPLTDLDHVPATADTVLARVRYLHEHYELERCRVLLLGDHDATSLAFGALGASVRELAVVDVDQRQLRYLASHGVDTWFADLRVGLPAPLRERFDIVLTDPPYSPAGIGLFAARALEAMKRESRLLVAYGYPEGSPALGLKVQQELSALELVYEAVLPDFNAYTGALAVGSRAALYVLRPTKRSRKIAARRGDRHAEALYTRGRQAVESSSAAPDFLGELEGVGYGPGFKRSVRELLDEPRPAESVVVNLAPDLIYSLFQVVRAVVAERVLIVAHNRTEGLRNAEEQALLRAVAAPRFEVVRLDRSWRGTPFTVVELRGTGAPRDERAVYREATST